VSDKEGDRERLRDREKGRVWREQERNSMRDKRVR
jgi:hypothetical protein